MPRLNFVMTRAKSSPKTAVLSTSKLLSLAESDFKKAIEVVGKMKKTKGHALRLGITGPPGAGKSSLISLLIKNFRKQKLKVAVIAVDPSSPFTGGAVLGDRIRMQEFFDDDGVFIRSVGSRGGFGGLSSATGLMARIFEAQGWDVVLIETVGVGQTELEIMNQADATAVVLVPESGDVVQTMKAGILEIADCFIVNKADRSGADTLAEELRSFINLEGYQKKNVFITSAKENRGVVEVAQHLLKLAQENQDDTVRLQERMRGELRSLLLAEQDQKIKSKIGKLKIKDPFSEFLKFSQK